MTAFANKTMSEVIGVVDFQRDAGADSAAPLVSGWLHPKDLGSARRLLAIAQMEGQAVDGETITVKMQKASDNSGTGAEDVGTTLTVAAHATNNDGKAFLRDWGPHQYDDAKPFIQFSCYNGATGAAMSLTVLAGDQRFDPSEGGGIVGAIAARS